MVMDITDENVNGYNVRAPHEVQVRPSRRARPTGSSAASNGCRVSASLGNAPTAGSPTCYFPSRTMPTESWWKGTVIRIDAVEDTVYQYTNGFREFQPNSHTLITSTGRLEGELTRRRLVESREDAVETALEIFATVDEKGEGFWQRFSEFEALDELFNYPDGETAQLVPNLSYACLRGLVVAQLLHRPNFEALVDEHRARLDQLPTNPVVRSGYESLVAALRGHWFH